MKPFKPKQSRPAPKIVGALSKHQTKKLSEKFIAMQVKPGEVRNPLGGKTRAPGWKPAHVQLREALQEKKRLGIDPIQIFVDEAIKQSKKGKPILMKALLDKLIANKIQIGVGPDDIQDVVNSVVDIIAKHVTNNKVREAIAMELEALDFDD